MSVFSVQPIIFPNDQLEFRAQERQRQNLAYAEIRLVIDTSARLATSVEGISKIGMLCNRIIEAVKAIFGAVSAGVMNLASALGHFSQIGEFVQSFMRVSQLIKATDKNAHWYEIGGIVATLVYRVIGMVNFIDKIGLANLGSFVSTVGSVWVLVPLSALANAFQLTTEIIRLDRNPIELEAAEAALALANLKMGYKEAVERNQKISKQQFKEACGYAHNRLTAARFTLIEKVGVEDPKIKDIDQLMKMRCKNFYNAIEANYRPQEIGLGQAIDDPSVTFKKSLINKKITYEIERWEKEVENLHIHKTRSILGILAAITKLVAITLGTIGILTGVAALAASSPLGIIVGLIVAGMAVAKLVYDKSCDENEMKLPTKPTILALKPEELAENNQVLRYV